MSIVPGKKKINHELRKLGFGGLDDPQPYSLDRFLHSRPCSLPRAAVLRQARQAPATLTKALRPHLSFAAKPLDVYEAEMKPHRRAPAAARYNERTHQLEPMKHRRDRVDEYRLERPPQEAIAQNLHEKERGLHLKCHKMQSRGSLPRREAQAGRARGARGWLAIGWEERLLHGCAPARCTMKLLCVECERESSIRCWDAQDGYAAARLAGWVINDTAKCPGCSVPKIRLV
jgi:hypothetical protein